MDSHCVSFAKSRIACKLVENHGSSRESAAAIIKRGLLSVDLSTPRFILRFRLQTVQVIRLFFLIILALAAAVTAECGAARGGCGDVVVAQLSCLQFDYFSAFPGISNFFD
jgi:hypothetical protein